MAGSGANPPSTPTVNNSHPGYPTIQFQKTPEGVFTRPVMQPRVGEPCRQVPIRTT